MDKKSLITFVIPSIGRKTLYRTLKSIKNQYIKNWNVFIIYDGIKNILNKNILKDKRIQFYELKKTGKKNNAGTIRNFGLSKCNTKWVGFLDDDDTISPDYINKFLFEINKYKYIDCLIFRMYSKNRIIPNKYTNKIKITDVGISFIINKKIYKKITFIPSNSEDFDYLKNIKKYNYNILLSNFVSYFVRSEPIQNINKLICNAKFNPSFFN